MNKFSYWLLLGHLVEVRVRYMSLRLSSTQYDSIAGSGGKHQVVKLSFSTVFGAIAMDEVL